MYRIRTGLSEVQKCRSLGIMLNVIVHKFNTAIEVNEISIILIKNFTKLNFVQF